MLKIRAIKFATSVNIGHSEEMFISERKPVDIYFDPANARYLLVDQKTSRQVWVHTTNVQWSEPVECETFVPRGTISEPTEPPVKHDEEIVPRGTILAEPEHLEASVPRGTPPDTPPLEPAPLEIDAQDHDHHHHQYSHKGASSKGSRRAGPQKGHSKTHLR